MLNFDIIQEVNETCPAKSRKTQKTLRKIERNPKSPGQIRKILKFLVSTHPIMISHRKWFQIIVTPCKLFIGFPSMFECIDNGFLAIICWTLEVFKIQVLDEYSRKVGRFFRKS